MTQTGAEWKASLLYFSFVTLTTVGTGTSCRSIRFARALANMEALIGQLFPGHPDRPAGLPGNHPPERESLARGPASDQKEDMSQTQRTVCDRHIVAEEVEMRQTTSRMAGWDGPSRSAASQPSPLFWPVSSSLFAAGQAPAPASEPPAAPASRRVPAREGRPGPRGSSRGAGRGSPVSYPGPIGPLLRRGAGGGRRRQAPAPGRRSLLRREYVLHPGGGRPGRHPVPENPAGRRHAGWMRPRRASRPTRWPGNGCGPPSGASRCTGSGGGPGSASTAS